MMADSEQAERIVLRCIVLSEIGPRVPMLAPYRSPGLRTAETKLEILPDWRDRSPLH
jgi:hypothetical protein